MITAHRFTKLERDELVAHQDADEKRTALAAARAATAVSQANVAAMQASIGALEASVSAAQANVAANEANVQRLMALQSFQRGGGAVRRHHHRARYRPWRPDHGGQWPGERARRCSGSPTSRTWRIFVNVPQTFVRSIAVGQEVRVLVPEYPQRPFVGKIASTAGALDQASRTLLTEVRLRNDDHALMPGMYAQVKFSLVPADDVWVIPATALITRAAGPQVVTVRGDGTVHYMSVQLGRDLGQSLEVVAGLSGNERLVVSPPDGLKEGGRVTVAGAREEPAKAR